MASNFEIGRCLGNGSFATVHLARDIRTRRRCALKLIDVTSCRLRASNSTNANAEADEPSISNLLQREIVIHTSVSHSQHPNIVKLLESFSYMNENTGGEMKALVLEHCIRGDFQVYMKKIREERKLQQKMTAQSSSQQYSNNLSVLPEGTFLSANEIRHVMSQLFCGLSFLHSRGIIHRDIKAPNLFLCPLDSNTTNATKPKRSQKQLQQFSLLDCQVKIGDFGLAVQMNDEDDWNEAQNTFCGTPSCLAPEVCAQQFTKKGGNPIHCEMAEFDDCLSGINASLPRTNQQMDQIRGYGQPADLWSCGCLLYTMITGRNPFALPTAAATTPLSTQGKAKRIQQIIERVVRSDWSIPAHVRIMDKSLDLLLHQLLEEQPRKRGSARGILNMHPFFQTSNTFSVEPTSVALSSRCQVVVEGVVGRINTRSQQSKSYIEPLAVHEELQLADSMNQSGVDGLLEDTLCQGIGNGSITINQQDEQVGALPPLHQSMQNDANELNQDIRELNVLYDNEASTIEALPSYDPRIHPKENISIDINGIGLGESDFNGNKQKVPKQVEYQQRVDSRMAHHGPISPQCVSEIDGKQSDTIKLQHNTITDTNRQDLMMQRLRQDLAAAKAAAVEAGDELFQLRKKKVKDSSKTSKLNAQQQSGHLARNTNFDGHIDNRKSTLSYTLYGRAGTMEVDANSMITLDQFVANLEPLS